MTQNEQILNCLKTGPVTPLGALKLFGCLRLAARIYDLRADGHEIHCERFDVSGKTVGRYTLIRLAGS